MVASSGSAAVANARKHTTYEPGYCQRFTRESWLVGSLYASAIEAWNGSAQKHPGDTNPPLGAPVYYSGGSYGHAVVFVSDGENIRSTDCQSTGKVSETDLFWPERNWGYKYLGWTGDINGVDLPLSSSNNSTEGDDMPQYDHAASYTDNSVAPDVWEAIKWESTSGAGAFNEGEHGCRIGGRTYSAVLHVQFDAPAGSVIRMRTVEYDPDTKKHVETNPQTEFVATGGTSHATHAQNGTVVGGRRLQFHVTCSQSAKLVEADAVVLSW